MGEKVFGNFEQAIDKRVERKIFGDNQIESQQANIRAMKIREENGIKQDKNWEPVSEIGTNNEEIDFDFLNSKIDMAASKIQAGFSNKSSLNKVSKGTSKGIVSMSEVDEDAGEFQSKNEKVSKKKIDIFLENPEENEDDKIYSDIDRISLQIQSSFQGNKRIHKTKAIKATNDESEKDIAFWEDPVSNEVATSIQAGYKGMVTREQMEKEDVAQKRKIEQIGRNIEDRLGIDLEDPKVIEAATKIQAGFRGAKTRKDLKNPQIVPDTSDKEYSEYESENSYLYEDEDEDSESYEERAITPKTAVENFSQGVSIAGFRVI